MLHFLIPSVYFESSFRHMSPTKVKDVEMDEEDRLSASNNSSRHNSIVYRSQVEIARNRAGTQSASVCM